VGNNTVGNLVRPAILRLPELTQAESQQLLDLLDELDLAEELPVVTLIGLAADADTAWADLRVGELKTLLGLAVGDEEAVLEGCAWIAQFGVLGEQRRRVYRCIENLLQLDVIDRFDASLSLLFGEPTLRQAVALVRREQQFFGLHTLGANMEGSRMHRQLLGAYQKVQRLKGALLN
jgi:ribosomal protein S12 methylthiotransferase accessory factor